MNTNNRHEPLAQRPSSLEDELGQEIDRRVAASDERLAMLHRVLTRPVQSEIEHQRIVELGTRALRCAYIALAGETNYDAFEDAFFAYTALVHADLLYNLDGENGQRFDAEFLVQNHDQAYQRVKECDAILAEGGGQAAIRSANTFFNNLKEDDPLRTLTNWLSLALNGRFLNFVDPAAIPQLIMECTVLCTDLASERMGGKLPPGKVPLDRADLRRTVIAICEAVRPLIEAGRLIFVNGRLTPKES